LQQDNAVSLHDPYGRRKTFKRLEFEACEVNLLKLLGGIRHDVLLAV
jgi:hypothetical protein